MKAAALSCTSLCQVIDRLEVGLIVLDGEQRIVHWNRWLAQRSGLPSEDMLGQSIFFAFPEALSSRLATAVEQAIQHGLPAILSPALHGTLLPLYQTPEDRVRQRRMHQLIHVLPLREHASQGACVIQISDMTATISRERLLRQQAENLRRTTTEDALTGLVNRRRFDEILASEFHKAQHLGTALTLMIADVDHFSAYNTLYGRELGDQALVELARLFRNAARPVVDTVGRYNGGALALILPGLTAEAACAFAEQLRIGVQSRAIAHDTSPTARCLTVSIGLTVMSPDMEADTHMLVSSADVALYQAKHEGHNRSVFFSVQNGQFQTCG